MMYFEIDDFNALRQALHRMCRIFLNEQIPEDSVFQIKLVADELLSNVLQHGGGRAYFIVTRENDTVRMCVRGSNEYRPPDRSTCASVLSESGRGLYLVDRLCERREFSEKEGIKVYIKI